MKTKPPDSKEGIECVNQPCPAATSIHRVTFYVHGLPNQPGGAGRMVEDWLRGKAHLSDPNLDEEGGLPIKVEEVVEGYRTRPGVDLQCAFSSRRMLESTVKCVHPEAIPINAGCCDTSKCPKEVED